MKKFYKINLNSKVIFCTVLALLFLFTRVCVFTPDLMEKRKYKKKMIFVRSVSDRNKRENSIALITDKQKPGIKTDFNHFNFSHIFLDEKWQPLSDLPVPFDEILYSGSYIDPPKLS